MPAPEKKVRVFISSTFKDMHAERDHLVTVVFPELRERCERLGLEFFDVDLRWGVPEKGADGETANSWEYCRQWIDRVEPFFVCLLGQRYGWEPEPEELKDEADRERQRKAKRSITDMEVRYGVLDAKLKRHSYFYLRDAEAPEEAADFVDPPQLLEKLDELKGEVRACGRPVRDYPCEWRDSAFTDMETFGRMVLEDLWSGILRDERYVTKDVWQQVLGTDPVSDLRYTDESVPVPEEIAEKIIPLAKPPPKDPLDAEREQMAAFADSRLRWFQGRTQEIDELTAFIRDPAEDSTPRLAVVAAVPGQGKSALMAKLASKLSLPQKSAEGSKKFADVAPLGGQSLFVISHFVGATETSSGSYHLVRRLIDELDASGIPFSEQPPPEGQPKEDPKLDFNSLCLRLSERLGDYDGKTRIVILLDALNQLDDGHDLGWLPHRLGPGVRIVVSCIEDPSSQDDSPERKVLAALEARFPKPKFIRLGGLDAADVRTIVEGYLLEYCKQLDPPHVDAICAMPQARNPLYLLVMLAELRTLGGNDMNLVVPELIAGMAAKHPDTISLFKWVLERMEAAEGFGAEAVKAWCIYLAIGRAGMASRELADLLARKLGPDADATALRIERGLRRYLRRRGETLDLFHGQLRQAVLERYGSEESIREAHRDIADYFLSQADPSQDKQWQGEPQRPFREIAFHLIGAQQWDELCDYLTDFRCLDVRIRAGQVFEVVTDQRAALAALPDLAEESRRERERVENRSRYGAHMIEFAREAFALFDSGREFSEDDLPILPTPPPSLESENRTEVYPSRVRRLRTVAVFVSLQSSLLVEFPEDFLPLAANTSGAYPLREALGLADEMGLAWIKREDIPDDSLLHPQCVQILRGHKSPVFSVSSTFGGRRVVSASYDRTLRVWDSNSGHCLRSLVGHSDLVNCVDVTPDGKIAISASDDKTIRVWDLESGQCFKTLFGHRSPVKSVAITPDGKFCVSGGGPVRFNPLGSYAPAENVVKVWDIGSGRCVHTLRGHSKAVESIGLTPYAGLVVSGSHDRTIRLWDADSGNCFGLLEGHKDRITCVRMTPDCSRLVSASYDRTIRVWDIKNQGKCLHILRGHTHWVTGVSITPDGRRAVSTSYDKTLRVWDVETGECLNVITGHSAGINSIAITPDGRRAVSGSGDLYEGWENEVRVWDLSSHESQPKSESGPISSIKLTSKRRFAVSTCESNSFSVWNLSNRKLLQTLKAQDEAAVDAIITTDGRRAISGSRSGKLQVWDIQSGRCLWKVNGHSAIIPVIRLVPDERRVVSGSADGSLRVWDLDTGNCLHDLTGHKERIRDACVTPDGRRLLSASSDSTLRLWDLNTGRCLSILEGHNSGVVAVSAVSDNRRAVSASDDQTLRVWSLETCQCLHTLEGHSDKLMSVCTTPDGRRAISGSEDKTVRVWDLQKGVCIKSLEGHTERVRCTSCTSDGQRAVSVSIDHTLRVWDLPSGKCLAIYHSGAAISAPAVFSTDDSIICGTFDGQMHFLTMRNFPECENRGE